MVERCPLPWHQIAADDLVFDGASEAARYRDEPHFGLLLHLTHRRKRDLLHRAGVEALLTGARAEAVVLGEAPPLHLADLLRSFRLAALWRELGRWQKALHEPFLNLLLRNAVGPLLNPRKLNRSLESGFRAPDWLGATFTRRYDLRARAELGRMPVRFRSPSAQYHYEFIGRSEPFTQRGFMALSTDLRHPFLYRPLVEFSLAIPWEAKVRPGVFKWLLRRAMAGGLPDVVRLRATKRGPGPAVYRRLPRYWPRIEPLLRDSVLAELGVFDARKFHDAGQLACLGHSRNFALLLGGIALEIWVRATFLGDELFPAGD